MSNSSPLPFHNPLRSQRSLIELALVIGTLLILKSALLRYDAFWTFAGPISLLMSASIATLCLWQGKESWSSLGLKSPLSFYKLAVWTVIALISTIGAGVVAQSLASVIFAPPDAGTLAIDARYQGRFDGVAGSLPDLVMWLAIAWAVGAFAEEMLFRAFLISRFVRVFAAFRHAVVIGVVLQALLFGQQHYYYQGVRGWFANGVIGLISGALYLRFGRSLWPLVISHGLSNTIGLTLIYFNPVN